MSDWGISPASTSLKGTSNVADDGAETCEPKPSLVVVQVYVTMGAACAGVPKNAADTASPAKTMRLFAKAILSFPVASICARNLATSAAPFEHITGRLTIAFPKLPGAHRFCDRGPFIR